MSDATDPPRLLDPAAGTPELGRYMREASELAPTDADAARLEAKLGPIFDGPAGAGDPGGDGPMPAGAESPLGAAGQGGILASSTGWTIGMATLVVVAAVATWAIGREDPASEGTAEEPRHHEPARDQPKASDDSISSQARSAEAETPPGPALRQVGSRERTPRPRRRRDTSGVTGAPATTPSAGVPNELSLIRAAQDALSRDPGRALTLTEEHASLHPAGELAQEREVIAIDALARLGRWQAAQRRAARLERSYPGSPHLRRVHRVFERMTEAQDRAQGGPP